MSLGVSISIIMFVTIDSRREHCPSDTTVNKIERQPSVFEQLELLKCRSPDLIYQRGLEYLKGLAQWRFGFERSEKITRKPNRKIKSPRAVTKKSARNLPNGMRSPNLLGNLREGNPTSTPLMRKHSCA